MKHKPETFDIKIDLHGMTSMQAFYKTLDTIESAYKSGCARRIFIITGIGDPARGTGVIRTEFPGWMEHPRIAGMILSAEPRHGGYAVLLRKNPNKPVI